MVFKLLGLGPKLYVADKFNIFDAVVTVITTVENIIDLAAPNNVGTGGAISGLRAVRLFRIFKLAR
jgi:Ion transport protein